MKKRTIRLQINKPLQGLQKGATIKLVADENSLPVDNYWRRRLKDADQDGCVEILASKKKVEEPIEAPEKEFAEAVEKPTKTNRKGSK